MRFRWLAFLFNRHKAHHTWFQNKQIHRAQARTPSARRRSRAESKDGRQQDRPGDMNKTSESKTNKSSQTGLRLILPWKLEISSALWLGRFPGQGNTSNLKSPLVMWVSTGHSTPHDLLFAGLERRKRNCQQGWVSRPACLVTLINFLSEDPALRLIERCIRRKCCVGK